VSRTSGGGTDAPPLIPALYNSATTSQTRMMVCRLVPSGDDRLLLFLEDDDATGIHTQSFI
jgi:hypothetical protein